MKIVFVAPRFHTNQVGIVRTLHHHGHDVEFHVAKIGPIEDHSLLNPVTFRRGFLSKILASLSRDRDQKKNLFLPGIIRYYHFLRSRNPDLIIVRNASNPFSLLAAFLGRLIGSKIIFYNQTSVYHDYSFPKRFLRHIITLGFGAAWMTPIEGDRREGARLSLSYFVPFVVTGHTIPGKSLKKEFGKIRVITVAKFQKRKNHELLLRSVSALKDFTIDLVLVGECINDAQKKIKQQVTDFAEELELSDRVTVVENVPPADMGRYYISADLMVLAASNESAGICVLESIAHGTPAICSTTCGARYYIKPRQNGAVFTDKDVSSLTRAIRDLILDRDHLERMRDECLRSAEQDFSPEAYYSAFLGMLRDRWPSMPVH